jgi:hypothetical protein
MVWILENCPPINLFFSNNIGNGYDGAPRRAGTDGPLGPTDFLKQPNRRLTTVTPALIYIRRRLKPLNPLSRIMVTTR